MFTGVGSGLFVGTGVVIGIPVWGPDGLLGYGRGMGLGLCVGVPDGGRLYKDSVVSSEHGHRTLVLSRGSMGRVVSVRRPDDLRDVVLIPGLFVGVFGDDFLYGGYIDSSEHGCTVWSFFRVG